MVHRAQWLREPALHYARDTHTSHLGGSTSSVTFNSFRQYHRRCRRRNWREKKNEKEKPKIHMYFHPFRINSFFPRVCCCCCCCFYSFDVQMPLLVYSCRSLLCFLFLVFSECNERRGKKKKNIPKPFAKLALYNTLCYKKNRHV